MGNGQHEQPANSAGADPGTSGVAKTAKAGESTNITPSKAAFSVLMPRGSEATDPAAADTVVAQNDIQITPRNGRKAPSEPAAGRWDPFRLPVVDKQSYRVAGEVAQGGNGRVLQARDERLDRPVALKELLATNASAEERFVCEALLTARLQHPSIVPIYEAGRWPSGEPFYAMKLVSGRSLADVIGQAKSLEARLPLLPHVLAVAEAVAYAHSERIIHRDLKPANILVGEFGETVVIDWGLAKDLAARHDVEPPPSDAAEADGTNDAGGEGLTLAGAIIGTPAYMPPEQAEGEVVDERADVYALGAILYHVLAGVPPYDGNSSMDILQQVLAGPPVAIDARQRGVPEDLRDIVQKAMARDPEGRYPTARELSDDLRRFQTGQIVAAHRYSRLELIRRFVRRYQGTLAVTAVALCLLMAMGWRDRRRVIEARDHAALRQSEAETAQRQATDRADDLTLVQARTALDQDPNRALAWLKTLSPAFNDWRAARVIAADAQARGISTALRGHTSAVNALAFSPDGSILASSSDDGTVRLWDDKTGRSSVWTGHTDEVYAIAFSSDGKMLASGSLDKTIRLWDVATGKSRVFVGSLQAVHMIAFSHDDKRLFSFGLDGAFRTWDVASGTNTATLAGEKKMTRVWMSPDQTYVARVDAEGLVYHSPIGGGDVHTLENVKVSLSGNLPPIAFSPDGKIFATGNVDHTIHLRDLDRGTLRIFIGHTKPVDKVVFSPDGKLLASAAPDGAVRLWDVKTGKPTILDGHKRIIRMLQFSHDGRWLASASLDHTARLWDVQNGTSRVLLGFDDAVVAVHFSPDDTRLAAASWDHTSRIWNLDAGPSRVLAGHDGAVHVVDFSPDGELLATAGQDGTARIWPLPGGDPILLTGHKGSIVDIAFSPDGRHIATAGRDETVRLWNREGKSERILRGHQGLVRAIAFSPKWLASAGYDGTVRLWNPATAEETLLSGHEGPVCSVLFSPDGRSLASSSRDHSVRLWDVASGKSRIFQGHTSDVCALAFSPDGQLLASAGDDHMMRLWSLREGRAIHAIPISGLEGAHQIVFSADGKEVTVMTGGSAVGVFSTKTGDILRVLRGHEEPVRRGVLSPDGQTLATASHDRTVRLWDLSTGESRALVGHTGPVNDVKFSPDGKLIASVSADNTVRLWADDLPADPAGLRAWLDAATPDTIAMGRHHRAEVK